MILFGAKVLLELREYMLLAISSLLEACRNIALSDSFFRFPLSQL